MTEQLVRKELIHKWPGYPNAEFMADIDATGGWPVGYQYVSFYHSIDYEGRYCKFGNVYLRDPYWTTVISADDYYHWKLSPKKKEELLKEARQQLISQLR